VPKIVWQGSFSARGIVPQKLRGVMRDDGTVVFESASMADEMGQPVWSCMSSPPAKFVEDAAKMMAERGASEEQTEAVEGRRVIDVSEQTKTGKVRGN